MQLAVPANFVKSIHESLPTQPVAGTLEWFLGLSVANGKLLPVTDLGLFLDRQASQGVTLELEPDMAVAALKVDEVMGVTEMQARGDVDTPTMDAKLQSTRLLLTGESVDHKGGLHRVLDLPALLQSSAFVNIKELDL